MKILLVNIAHPSIGSRIPKEQLPPLGLLYVGGSLLDQGYHVKLLDGELAPKSEEDFLVDIVAEETDMILFGHSGSSTAHPIISNIAVKVKQLRPNIKIIYGGVYPTYHWRDILSEESHFDFIVRGEGEQTIINLCHALQNNLPLNQVNGIAYKNNGKVTATAPAIMIKELDDYRIGWELIDHKDYSYWGGKRAVVVQFSRGCPHLCNYCGQRGFWTKYRYRKPQLLADEIEHLHKYQGVEVFNFADENPSAARRPWTEFLEALIKKNLDITLVASTRADDIVRDADIMHLYKAAGFERFLMGMESTDQETLTKIKKGGEKSKDKEAIQILRSHNILSMATWVVGFHDETHKSLWQGLRQLIVYDPDQIQMLYVTPHRWTPYYSLAQAERIIQRDKTKWDYKHQVLEAKNMSPMVLFMWAKVIELCLQVRPKALVRYLYHPDKKIHHAIKWYYKMGRRVWFHEILSFIMRDKREAPTQTLKQFWGETLEHEEEALGRSIQQERIVSAKASAELNA